MNLESGGRSAKPGASMATNRSYLRRPHRTALSPDQAMDLWLGPRPQDELAPFPSDEARRAAWTLHGPRLAVPSSPGRRPMAWWQYDAPIPWPGIDRERSTLYAAGLLGEEERRVLAAEWRLDFDRAQKPDFWLCLGPGEWLEGRAARRAHYRWADIPRPLIRKWTAERKRAAQTIRKLEAEAIKPSRIDV